MNLTRRHLEGERMDDPALDGDCHRRALSGLSRINWISRADAALWQPIQQLAGEMDKRPLSLLDIATGGGDIPLRLWQRARRNHISLQIDGCDKSPQAVQCANRLAERQDANVRFFPLDIFTEELPRDYDIVSSSLFLHHLQDDEALMLLEKMARAARRLVLINDLVRSVPGFLAAYAGTRILTSSKIVHIDGPLSVRASFTIEEIHRMLELAGLRGARIRTRWPFRYLVVWKKPFQSN